MTVCQRIGPELTAEHVLPQLKEFFDELAFSQEAAHGSGSFSKNSGISKPIIDGESQIESRMDLVWVLLYSKLIMVMPVNNPACNCVPVEIVDFNFIIALICYLLCTNLQITFVSLFCLSSWD